MSITLRPATPDDLPFRVALHNALIPEFPTTLAEVSRHDAGRRADFAFGRWIAEEGGRPLGQGLYTHQEWMYHPQKFFVDVKVRPEAQGRGVGQRLWAHLESEVRALGAQKLFASVREDHGRGVRFLQERGFGVEQREREAALTLAQAPLGGLDAALERVRAQGYTLSTFAGFADPDRERKLYAFDEAASRDVPRPNEEMYVFPTLERYWQHLNSNPDRDDSLWFVALKDGELVGLSQLNPVKARPEMLGTGFTAVARAHRRRGLALALKLTALSEARRRGYLQVRTSNDDTNAPMIAINTALGFQEEPAWLWMTRKELD
ncbi:GNAT family N-acetyltransferase [Deinococcus irradiatisoli]|nr:GNAT family N-acetyltransferase [Deinococcus irradiatisoli]